MSAIEGKVAKIIDEYNLVINVGATHGVKPGMRFVVFAEGDEVIDPDTGESLGKWEAVKGHIVAAHVQDRLTICRAPIQTSDDATQQDRSTRTLSAAMIEVSMRGQGAEGNVKLNVNKAQIDGAPQVGPISVGDRVRSVEIE